MAKIHIHIGHHFFGAGNVGDDLMLAGFLQAVPRAWLENTRLTCCTAHDARSQRQRFPQVDWLPYDRTQRLDCIRACDAWLGLGDTPFQGTGSHTWFLDHLCQEAAWCRQENVPMYYLGVGVNEASVVAYPQMRVLVEQAERIWMRDAASVEMLRTLAAPGKATAHADLAHLILAETPFPAPEPGVLGLVLSFEGPGQFSGALTALVEAAGGWNVRWLVQEVRPLPGSELELYGQLPAAVRDQASLRTVDYARASSPRTLLDGWHGVEALFTGRYHAAVIGAWMGARVAVFPRNDKVAGAVRQLGLPVAADMRDTAAIFRAIQGARPVERRLLQDLTESARGACASFVATVQPRRFKRTVGPATTVVAE